MGTKLRRVREISLVLLLLGQACDVFAASTELDERMLEARQKFPANSFIVMEAQLFGGDSQKVSSCQTMSVTLKSEQGKTSSLLVQELFIFDKANNKYGGGAVLPPGTYTIVQVTCASKRYQGNFARFTLQTSQSVNLGCLIVEYKSSPLDPLAYPTYSGIARVVDLSPLAVASLRDRVPVSFGQTVKRYMAPILTGSTKKRSQ